MERLFFILNPVAGTGRGAKYFPQLRAVLDAKGVDYGYARSEHPGHAVELTRQAVAAGEKRIIAVGGRWYGKRSGLRPVWHRGGNGNPSLRDRQ